MNRRVTVVGLGIALIGLTTAIGACTGSGGGGSANAVHGAAVGGAAAGAATKPLPPAASATPQNSQSYDRASRAGGASLASIQIGGSKIRIANMSVQVKHGQTVAEQANAAEAIALGAGGEVDADDRSSGDDAVATLVLRVPPDQLAPTLTQLSKLGIEKSRRLSTQDVTSRVADVNSRVASAQGAIARLRVLYQHARKIGDVINIESELSQRESDLEALQAQQRALAAETSTAAITLTLTSPPKIVKKVVHHAKHHNDSGFLGGLRNGWHAFTGGAKVLATVVGAVLPFAVLLAVLGLIARLLWPRLRPTRQPAPIAPPQ